MASSPRAPGEPVLRDLLEPVMAGLGLDLEGVDVQATGSRRRVCVVVDRDGGIDLDGIAEASKAASAALDDSDAMGDGPYTLEVTSPGVDRPLTLPRHWRRNVGRRVHVVLTDGSAWDGRIRGANDDELVVAVDRRGGPEAEERRTPWSQVARGQVQVEFRRPESAESESESESESAGEEE